MSDFPFSIPRRGDADVVNGVSYAGDTLTLTRAEGSDLTTTIATSDPTKIENGNSSMEIASENGACVFTPAGLTAKTTTFAADGDIITSGNVGIGDDAPDAPLQIKGDGVTSSSLRIESTNAAGAGYMYIQRNTDGKSYVLNATNHPLILGAHNDTNQLYLKEDGNVGINDTTPTEKLEVGGNIKSTDSIMVGNYIRPTGHNYLNWNTGAATGDDNKHYWRFNWYSGANAEVNFVNLAGDNNCIIRAQAYSNISDDRTKLNETPIENAMDTLKKLNPVTYDYYGNLDCSGVGEFSAGLVAQEVWYNCPELRFIISTASDVSLNHADISNDDWGTGAAGVNYTEIMPYMIKAIQDQETTIEKLAERLAALENN